MILTGRTMHAGVTGILAAAMVLVSLSAQAPPRVTAPEHHWLPGRRRAASAEAYKKDVGQRIRTALDGMPYQVIENDVKSAKSRADIASPALVIGSIREQIQPTVDKTGSLSSDQAPGVVNASTT